jgi:putative DNA primase/helicase
MWSQSEIVDNFKSAMAADGICTDDPIIPDQPRIGRFQVKGDKPRTRNGWYILHSNGLPAGAYGSWKLGVQNTWRWQGPRVKPDAAWKKRVAEAEKQRKEEEAQFHERARLKAQRIWERLKPAPADHPYLAKKQVQPHGIRASCGRLVIPLRDVDGVLRTLQFISWDGEKRFLGGGRKQGCFHLIGNPDGKLFLAEGYATAATVYQITGQSVAAAIDAGNLLPLANALRKKFTAAEMAIAADDDHATEGNPGLTAAKEAAKAVKATVLIPRFKQRRDTDTDFNDLARLEGRDVVRRQLRTGPAPFEAPTVSEFMRQQQQMPPVKPLLGDILHAQEVVGFIARRRNGKTTLLTDMLAAVSDGERDWLGFSIPAPLRVLYVYLEDLGWQIEANFEKRMPSFPERFRLLTREHFKQTGWAIKLTNGKPTQFMDCLRATADEYRPEILVLDNAVFLLEGKFNDPERVMVMMNYAIDLAADYNCAVIIPAHPRKFSQAKDAKRLKLARDAEGFFEEVLGSSVFINQAPSLWGLERDYQTGITTALLGAQRTTGDQSLFFLGLDDETKRFYVSRAADNMPLLLTTEKRQKAWDALIGEFTFEQGCRKVHIASEMSRPAYARFINHALRLGLMQRQGGLYSKNQA